MSKTLQIVGRDGGLLCVRAHWKVGRRRPAAEDVGRGDHWHACDGDVLGRATEANALEERGVHFERAALGKPHEGEAAVAGAGAGDGGCAQAGPQHHRLHICSAAAGRLLLQAANTPQLRQRVLPRVVAYVVPTDRLALP